MGAWQQRFIVAGVIVAGLFGVAAPAMAAPVKVAVIPSTAAPGDSVTVQSSCQAGEVRSSAFLTTNLEVRTGSGTFRTAATVTVDLDVQPGVYDVEARCSDGQSGSTQFTVAKRGVPAGDGSAAGGPDLLLVAGGAGILALAMALGLGVRLRRTG